jgi:hypothetical protein
VCNNSSPNLVGSKMYRCCAEKWIQGLRLWVLQKELEKCAFWQTCWKESHPHIDIPTNSLPDPRPVEGVKNATLEGRNISHRPKCNAFSCRPMVWGIYPIHDMGCILAGWSCDTSLLTMLMAFGIKRFTLCTNILRCLGIWDVWRWRLCNDKKTKMVDTMTDYMHDI